MYKDSKKITQKKVLEGEKVRVLGMHQEPHAPVHATVGGSPPQDPHSPF